MSRHKVDITGVNTANIKVLTKEETKELLIKINEGDKEAKDKIIIHNIRLVIHQVNEKFNKVDWNKEDLVSYGILGLIKAINSFDLSKNIEFTTYAAICIENEIKMYLRRIKKYENIDSINKSFISPKDGNELFYEEVLYDKINIEKDFIKKDVNRIIKEFILKLPSREKEIIMLYFGFYKEVKLTQREIANQFNVSQRYISKIIKKVLIDLKKELEKVDIIEKRKKVQRRRKVKQ